MALERPCPNSSGSAEARQGPEAPAGGPQGLLPEQGVAMRGPQPDSQPTLGGRPSALVYLWLRETQEGRSGACSSCCMAAFCSCSSGGEECRGHGTQLFWGMSRWGVGRKLGARGPAQFLTCQGGL